MNARRLLPLVIVAGVSISLVVLLPLYLGQSNQSPHQNPTWHTLKAFTGSAGQSNNLAFTIQGQQARYSWNANIGNVYYMNIELQRNGVRVDYVMVGNCGCVSRQIGGPGNYTFNVDTNGPDPWYIPVEDYY